MDDKLENNCEPGKMSTSPTHSLPNVGNFGMEFDTLGSLQHLDNSRVVSVTALDDVTGMPCLGRLQSDNSVNSTAICHSLGAPGQHLVPPVLHRALSTSPRLEHTCDSQLLADNNSVNLLDGAEDFFFPWSGSSQDIDISSSLPTGRLHDALRFCSSRIQENDAVGSSDTMLSKEHGTSADGVRKPLVGCVRSSIRGLTRSSLTSSNSDSQRRLFRIFSRQDSQASAGSLVSKCRGSSIFGSKMFESLSSCSVASQHVHVVAESTGVYPVPSSQYSMECSTRQNDATPVKNNGFFSSHKSLFPIGANGHVSSASCINDVRSFGIPGEEVALHRSVSLPSRYHYHHETQTPTAAVVKAVVTDNKTVHEKLQDEEDVDNVSELKPSAPVVATAAGKRKWQQTMPDLVEGPESDTLTTAGSNRVKLAAAALAIIRGEYNDPGIKEAAKLADTSEEMVFDERCERRRYIKNLVVLSLSFFFIFTSFLSIRNLQSSLNVVGGLGLYSLSTVYAFLFIGSLFTTTIVQRLGPKRALACSMLSFVLYNIANFYPRFYTLIPVSAFVGFFLAVLWTSHATYVTNIAVGYATLTDSKTSEVLRRFHSIFFAFFQASQIAGGLISSLLLSATGNHSAQISSAMNQTNQTELMLESLYYNFSWSSDNVSTHYNLTPTKCGSLYCPSEQSATQHTITGTVNPNLVLLLIGMFLISTATGLLILIFFLDPLEGIMKKTHATFQHQMTAVFRFFCDRRVVCLFGLPFYSLMQSSFMFGEFTKVYSLLVHLNFLKCI